MRILIALFVLVVFVPEAQAQSNPTPQCPIQQLAIDAALGEAAAQYNLAVEFFRGANVPRDYAKAATLWRKASDGGHVGASNNLGFLKYHGRPGVDQDFAEGIRLWRFAAERGWAESQVHLGQAYSDGRFLKIDLVEAYAWARSGKHYAPRMAEILDNPQIGEQVSKLAESVLAEARSKLSPQEISQAEKKAADYINKFGPK